MKEACVRKLNILLLCPIMSRPFCEKTAFDKVQQFTCIYVSRYLGMCRQYSPRGAITSVPAMQIARDDASYGKLLNSGSHM